MARNDWKLYWDCTRRTDAVLSYSLSLMLNFGYVDSMLKTVTSLLVLTLGLINILPVCASEEHSSAMQPVHPMLRTGCQFDDKYLPAAATEAKWFRIPKWFAGTWQRTEITNTALGFIKVKQMDIRRRHYGFQSDARGRVWHWVRTPFPVRTERRNEFVYFQINKEEPVDVNKDSVTIHMTWTAWDYDRFSGVIRRVHQGDQFDVFTQKSPGVITCHCNLASYDQNGKHLGNGKSFWDDYCVEPYQQIDEFEGKDLRAMFASFLEENGLADRIPIRSDEQTTGLNTGRSDWQE